MLNAYRNLKLAIILYQANNSGGAWRSIMTYYRDADLNGDPVRVINRMNRRTFRQVVAAAIAAPRLLFNGLDSFHRWEAIALCLLRRNAMIYLHETGYMLDQFKASSPLRYRLVQRILKRNQVLAVSEQAASLYRERFGSENVVVVYECLPSPSELVFKKADRKRICMVGTIEERKGATFFSRIADKAEEKKMPWDFHWIGGKGSQESCYLSENVTWWGWQDHPRDFVKRCDLFLLASVDDPFPLACLEALQDRVRAVAYSRTGVSEVLHALQGCAVFDDYKIDTALKAVERAMNGEINDEEIHSLMKHRIEVSAFRHRMNQILAMGSTDELNAPSGGLRTGGERNELHLGGRDSEAVASTSKDKAPVSSS